MENEVATLKIGDIVRRTCGAIGIVVPHTKDDESFKHEGSLGVNWIFRSDFLAHTNFSYRDCDYVIWSDGSNLALFKVIS